MRNRHGHRPDCCCGKIHGSGRRMTPARHAVLDALMKKGEHLTAEDVFGRAGRRYPNLGLATVYRTLELLTRLSMVAKFDAGNGRACYEFVDRTGTKEHHHHLICTLCSKIVDYNDFINEEMELLRRTEKGLSAKYDFKITGHLIQFYGLCKECAG